MAVPSEVEEEFDRMLEAEADEWLDEALEQFPKASTDRGTNET